MQALCNRVFIPAKQTRTVQVVSALSAVLCFVGTVVTFTNYSYLAFGMSAAHFTGQSGIVHFARALNHELPATFRLGILGFGVGVCLIMHTFLRGFYRDAYLEHIGGHSPTHAGETLQVVLCHVLAPFLSLFHAYKAPSVSPLYVALFIFVDISLVVLLHEVTAIERRLESTTEIILAYICSLAVAFGAALLAETVNRALK